MCVGILYVQRPVHNVVIPFLLVCMYPLTFASNSHSYTVHSVARFSKLPCWAARALRSMTSSLAPLPVAFRTVPSVAECATVYCVSLTTKQRCGLRLRAGSLCRVGAACSGTDSVVRVLEHLGRSSGWDFERTFSCECDDAKQTWLQENFPQMSLIFTDICDVQPGRAFNVITGEESNVPAVDLSAGTMST